VVSPPSASVDDTAIPDKLWDGMLALLRGTLAVASVAVAVASTVGWPRRAPAELTGFQISLLAAQALASAVALGWCGRRLSRRYPGALAVAFTAMIPAALGLLLTLEWRDPREPRAGWWELLRNSLALAAIIAPPAAVLLWRPCGSQPALESDPPE
jgi:hypothetical protein